MFMYWVKTKTARQHPAAFQKVRILLVAIGLLLTRRQCILAYISDTHLYAILGIALPISSDFGVIVAYRQRLTHLASNEYQVGLRL
jgi:hypothetical protein